MWFKTTCAFCLLRHEARGGWLFEEGEKKKHPEYPAATWFKSHLASDTGGQGADMAARSWEQIRDLLEVHKGRRVTSADSQNKTFTSSYPESWSESLTRIWTARGGIMRCTSWRLTRGRTHGFLLPLLQMKRWASITYGALPGLCQWLR